MRPGREIDCAVAQKVFGHRVFVKKRVLFEDTPKGDRPLRFYSKDIAHAWEVVEKLGISILPIENGDWFALVGSEDGWKTPAEFVEYLHKGNFVNAGAAVGKSAPQVICIAAIKSMDLRNSGALQPQILNSEVPVVEASDVEGTALLSSESEPAPLH